MALDRYAIGDTPTFEVDVFAADQLTPVTPTGPVTLSLTNLRTQAAISTVSAVVTITGNRVAVTLPAAATKGQFRAAAQVTVDATPTVRSATYDYEVVATSEAT